MHVPMVIRSRFRFAGDLARAADVARVLAKYGLATWMKDIDWEPIHRALKSETGEQLSSQPFEARVRLATTDLGVTFIKLGQMLSTRPDLVGQTMATELTKLQASTPPDPPEVAVRVVERELGQPISELFKDFNPVPLASASIGQVHIAHLKSGRRAVVKVQHPDIEATIRRDLDILGFLAEIAEMNDFLRRYQPVNLIREFGRTMLNELDFRRELRNLQAFRRNFADDPTIVFPRPHPELASGRVMTMEYLEGFKVSDEARLQELQIDRAELAKHGANVYVQMIFRDGFYHADPHPGNILILPSGKIGLLDAGMVGRVDEKFRRQIEDILMAAGDRNAARLTDAVTRVCGTPVDLDRDALSSDLTEFFQEFGTASVGSFDVSGALTHVTDILHQHKLILPGKLSMLIKCLIMLEGTGRLLSPSFSLAEILAPYRAKFLWRRFSPAARLRDVRQLYMDLERMAQQLPAIVTRMVDRFDNGQFAIRLEHRHAKASANRIVTAILLAAFLLASSILLAQKVSPAPWGISIPGALGYFAAFVLGARMIWLTRRHSFSRRERDWD